MNLYDRIKSRIDYNNHYTIQKALSACDLEFNQALKTKNSNQAREVIGVVKQIYDDLNDFYKDSEGKGNTMSYAQKALSHKILLYLSYLAKKLK